MNAPHPPPRPRPDDATIAALTAELHKRYGNRVVTSLAVRQQHGHTTTWVENQPPDIVVYPQSTAEVSEIVRLCAGYAVPVVAFGTGTSLEGHVAALHGGVCIDLSRMNRIAQVNAEDLDATVEAGVTRKQLNEYLRDTGLFFPIDPGADASLGGMAATRASGTNAVRYGTMRENVLALEVVTASGEVIRTGTRAKKSSAGYDLTRLFVGSEGTLGVITEVTLRLFPLPEAISAAICHFPSVTAAVDAVIEIIQMGVPIARVELLDANAVRAVNRHDKLTLRETPMLLMEFHGSPSGVDEQATAVQSIAHEHSGEAFEWASTPEDRTRLWTARHRAYFAGMAAYPGRRTVTTDACVPISRLAEAIGESVREADESGIPYYIVGHVGDGNYHVAYLIDPKDAAQWNCAEQLNLQLVQRALRLEGTCTGEHGVGLHKQGFLVDEAGEGAVAMMRTLKRALDPKNILNPGKIFAL